MSEARGHRVGSLQLAVAAVAMFLAGPVLATLRLIPARVGFGLFVLGGLLGFGVAVAAVLGRIRRSEGRRMGPLLLGGIPAVFLVVLAIPGARYPAINDVSTDLGDPPAFVQAQTFSANHGRDLSYPESFKETVRRAYPKLGSLHLPDPPGVVFERALLYARATPRWELTRVDRDTLTFEGVDTSRLFKFRDDFVVRLRPEGSGSVVDMRSKSRDGKGDLGTNAARIQAFLETLRQK